MKVRDSNTCSYCNDVIDFMEHFFYECPVVSNFWKVTEQFILTTLDKQIKLSVTDVLFGIGKCDGIRTNKLKKINHIILIAKMCTSIFKKTNSAFPLQHIFEKQLHIRRGHF